MPMMKAHILLGFSQEQKTAALAGYTRAIEQALDVPRKTIRIMLEELGAGCSAVAGEIDAELTIIEVFMMVGRTDRQRTDLIAGLTDATATAFGVSQASVRILIHDMPKINVGIGGQSAQALGR